MARKFLVARPLKLNIGPGLRLGRLMMAISSGQCSHEGAASRSWWKGVAAWVGRISPTLSHHNHADFNFG
jgi:hypothetical protein